MTTPRAEVRIAVAPDVLERFRAALDQEGAVIRLVIDANFEHALFVDRRGENDLVLKFGDVTMVLDQASAKRADGLAIEWEKSEQGAGLRLSNPNRPDPVRLVDAAFLESCASLMYECLVIDVRTEEEYQEGHLASARLLDETLIDALEKLDRRVPLLFSCDSGIRSRKAAEHYRRAGFLHTLCLDGGLASLAKLAKEDEPQP